MKTLRAAFSLLEILAVVTLIGIVAAIIVPRFAGRSAAAKKNACLVNQGNIEVQVELWYRHKGSYPASSLADIGADGAYFPDSLPTCPVDGSTYQIDASTGEVVGHTH